MIFIEPEKWLYLYYSSQFLEDTLYGHLIQKIQKKLSHVSSCTLLSLFLNFLIICCFVSYGCSEENLFGKYLFIQAFQLVNIFADER